MGARERPEGHRQAHRSARRDASAQRSRAHGSLGSLRFLPKPFRARKAAVGQQATAVDANRLPRHIAVIMDGNGRWARSRRMPRLEGHRAGVESVRAALRACSDLGVEVLTIYAFSTENWLRPESETTGLMRLMVEMIDREIDNLDKEGVRILAMGDLDGLPPDVAASFRGAEARTAGNRKIILNVAINYGSRAELADAASRLAAETAAGTLLPDEIDEAAFASRLYRSELPDPDLLIRTSGEKRLSNFMLWQLAYAELVFLDVLWPDFGREELIAAIIEYQGRERRFGGNEDG